MSSTPTPSHNVPPSLCLALCYKARVLTKHAGSWGHSRPATAESFLSCPNHCLPAGKFSHPFQLQEPSFLPLQSPIKTTFPLSMGRITGQVLNSLTAHKAVVILSLPVSSHPTPGPPVSPGTLTDLESQAKSPSSFIHPVVQQSTMTGRGEIHIYI